jgi:DNA-binding XRE family transcriptional regulator
MVPGLNGMDELKDIPVFVPTASSPAFRLAFRLGRDEARELVNCGRAKWRRHCRAILLLSVFDLRDFSCRFQPSASLSASVERRAAIDSWPRCPMPVKESMTNLEFRRLRIEAEVPQSAVAYRAGVDRGRLVLWEREQQQLRPEEIIALETALLALIQQQLSRLSSLLEERNRAAAV